MEFQKFVFVASKNNQVRSVYHLTTQKPEFSNNGRIWHFPRKASTILAQLIFRYSKNLKRYRIDGRDVVLNLAITKRSGYLTSSGNRIKIYYFEYL